jgi:hypothetical protein
MLIRLGSHVRRVIAVGMPLFSTEEQQRQLEKYSEQPLRPATEADRADIRPLDVASALVILLAEVRAGLDKPGDAAHRRRVYRFLMRRRRKPGSLARRAAGFVATATAVDFRAHAIHSSASSRASAGTS